MCRLPAVVIALACSVVPAAALAEGPSSSPGPKPLMEDYFAGEKAGGVTLIAMGAAGVGSGAVLATRNSDFASGLGYPLLGVGAVHAAAGVFVIVSSNRRIDEFGARIDGDADEFTDTEHARMKGVQTQFFVLKIVEGVLIAGGVGLAIYGEREDRPTLSGLGTGIAIEAAATLVFDVIAAQRAAGYVEKLEALRVGVTSGAEERRAYSLIYTQRF